MIPRSTGATSHREIARMIGVGVGSPTQVVVRAKRANLLGDHDAANWVFTMGELRSTR